MTGGLFYFPYVPLQVSSAWDVPCPDVQREEDVVIKPFINANGVTVAELQKWLETVPTVDPKTGEPNTVWMETGPGVSSPVRAVRPLNAQTNKGRIVSCDLLLKEFED
jgi:hypothetical protein